MFEKVLVGVDGKANGRDAIALAARLIDPEGELTFAHVHPGRLSPSRAISPGLVRGEREASEVLLARERACAELEARLLSLEALSPGRGLHEQAEAQDADLLVVGSCSRGVFGRAMLGDDTREALNGAPCAVAIAARGYAERSAPIANIGVAYNGSPESTAALAVARQLASGMSGVTLHALEVVSLPSVAYSGIMSPVIGEDIELMLQEATGRLEQLPDVDSRAVYGLPGEELASFGDEVDLLIVGSRGYGPVKRLVLGSTSTHLQRHARCSLLVLTRLAGGQGADSNAASTRSIAFRR